MVKDIQIILVEDNKADLFLFEQVLENMSLKPRLLHFNYGAAFLEAIQKEEFVIPSQKIIFIDYNLPQQNGWDIIQALMDRPSFEDAHFVLMSNLLPSHLKNVCVNQPKLSCLEKDFEYEKFLQKITQIINRYGKI